MPLDANHLIALGLLLLAIPAAVLVATFSERARDVAFFGMVAGAVVTDRMDITFISHYWYRGTTRGFEFSLVDLLAISVLVSSLLRPRPGNPRFFWPASFGFMLLFFGYAAVSVAISQPQVYGIFELSKMLRGFILFLGAALYVRSRRELGILVVALCCAVSLQGVLALKQRFLLGMDRVPGTLDHENSLSMYLCLVSPIFVAAAASSLPRWVRIFSVLAIPAAALASVLTVSRAGIPIFALIMLGTTAWCVSWRVTPRKVFATALVALCVAALFAKTWPSLKERYAEASFKDEYLDEAQEGRGYYLRLAKVIVHDKFMGVGLNNWSYWVSKKYGIKVGRPYDDYDSMHIAEPDDRQVASFIWAAPAHNLAALTVGELGVPGLLLFLVLWARWFLMGLPFLFYRTPDPMYRLGIGLWFGLCGIFLQSLTEWTFRQSHIFMTFNIFIGTLASLLYARRHVPKPVVEAEDLELPGYAFTEPFLNGRGQARDSSVVKV